LTLRRIDSRFLLPHPVSEAVVLDGIAGWTDELERLGIQVYGERDAIPPGVDLAVVPGDRIRAALAHGPRAVISEGRAPRHASRRYLPLPRTGEPAVYVPLGRPAPSRYAFTHWAFADRRWKRLRNRAVGSLAGRDALPRLGTVVAVSAAHDRPPFLVTAAREWTAGPTDWFLIAGQGDDFSRGAFLLFEPGAAEPSWALKFGRLPIALPAFDSEERGLQLAARAGPLVSAHAPRQLARFECHGLSCSVETAARGTRLLAVLESASTRGERVRVVERLCAWLLEVARETAQPPAALAAERDRLATEVVPEWEVPAGLVEELPPVPAVFAHHDLGSWNILVEDGDFTVLDWEDAVPAAFPLWDLWYLLTDAAAVLDGARAYDERLGHFVRLFRGDLETSALVFDWTRRTVSALDLPADAVGTIATLGWLHHGLTGRRRTALSTDGETRGLRVDLSRGQAEAWLADPQLGSQWKAWRV
jgi:hypothetical protein